jgi:hypothetical protein
VQRLAAAAHAHSSLPFFVNAWLDSDIDINIPGFTVAGGQKPGMYPSGGPIPRVADVWTTVATDVDLFAPDVYFGDTEAIYASFSAMTGGLFIPSSAAGRTVSVPPSWRWGSIRRSASRRSESTPEVRRRSRPSPMRIGSSRASQRYDDRSGRHAGADAGVPPHR